LPLPVLTHKKAATRAASCCSFCCGSFHDDDSLVFIKVGEHHLNNLALLRRHMLTDVVRLNRQLAMFIAAIDQYGKLHAPRPSEILSAIRFANGTPRRRIPTSIRSEMP